MTDPTVPGAGTRMSYVEALGAAFTELIEHLPEAGHARSGITMVVHVDEHRLRAGIGAATLASGGMVSITQARRLACEAGILPMVMGGASVALDLGTASRFFTRGQALALPALRMAPPPGARPAVRASLAGRRLGPVPPPLALTAPGGRPILVDPSAAAPPDADTTAAA